MSIARSTPSRSAAACLAACLAALLACRNVRAAASVSLEPASEADPAVWPYRPARLTIGCTAAAAEATIRAVRLRERAGGPTVRVDVTVAPSTRTAVVVPLPAWTQQQEYAADLLDGEGEAAAAVSEHSPRIRWPLEWIDPEAFFDAEAYRRWRDELPRWPASLLRALYVTAAAGCIAMVGALLIRRPAWRTAAALAAAAAATAGIAALVLAQDVVVRREPADAGLIVLSCRRTAQWADADARLAPVYQGREDLADDDMVIRWPRGVRLTLRPQEVRLLRKVQRRDGGG